MRLDENSTYELANGELGNVRTFFMGDEHIPAHYQGSVEENDLTKWLPNGDNMDTPDWNIVKKAHRTMLIKNKVELKISTA